MLMVGSCHGLIPNCVTYFDTTHVVVVISDDLLTYYRIVSGIKTALLPAYSS